MGDIVKLCDNHVENLLNNSPCDSCPIRKDPLKYKRCYIIYEILKISTSVMFLTSFFIGVILFLVNFDMKNINICDKCESQKIDKIIKD